MRLLSVFAPLWLWLYARYRGFMASILRLGPIPTHVGFIMDGNRRFADKIRTDRSSGHRHGFTKLLDILEWCLELGVSNVSVFAFGVDNFKRDQQEVADLMRLAEEKLWQLLEEKEIVAKHRIHIKVLGELHLLPSPVERAARQVMKATQHYDGVTLNICLAYSSRLEMAQARQAAALHKAATTGQRTTAFERQLYTKGQPPVDLLIRTSGETRLSDFLLWQCATAELVFSKALWPEFSYLHLLQALVQYQQATPALTAIKAEWGKWTGAVPLEEASHQRQDSLGSWGVASSRGLDSEAADGSSASDDSGDDPSSASEEDDSTDVAETPFAAAAGNGSDRGEAAAGRGLEAAPDSQAEAERSSAEATAAEEAELDVHGPSAVHSEHHRVPSISGSISAAPSAAMAADGEAQSADSIFAGGFTAAAFDPAASQPHQADSSTPDARSGDKSAAQESASQLPGADAVAHDSHADDEASLAASGSSQAGSTPVTTGSDSGRDKGRDPADPTAALSAAAQAASTPQEGGRSDAAAATDASSEAQEGGAPAAEASLSAPRTPDRKAVASRGYSPIPNTPLSPFSQHVASPPASSAESLHMGPASLPTSPKSALRTSASFAASESGATPKHARFQDSPTFSSRHSSKAMPMHSAHSMQRQDSALSVQSVASSTHTPLRTAYSLQRQDSRQVNATLQRRGSTQSLPALHRQGSSDSLAGLLRADSVHSMQSVRRSHTPMQNAVSMPIRRQGSTASITSSKAASEVPKREVRRPFEENRAYSMPRRVHHVHAPGAIQEECPCCNLERKLPRHRVHSMPMTSSMAQGPSHGLWH